MKNNNSIFGSLIMTLLMAISIGAQTVESQDFSAILKTIDTRATISSSDFSGKLMLTTEDPEKDTETISVQMFRRDKEDKFLMLVLKPESRLGQGDLRIDNNLWFYDPESRKFTHTSMKEAFQGTNAKNSDFARSAFATDYKIESSIQGKLGKIDVWILALISVNDEVTYPFRKVWISQKDSLLLKSEDFSLTKRLLRTSYWTSYTKIDGFFIADKMLFVDALVAGKKTAISLSDLSIKALPDSVFSKAYVEKVNR
jgi:outer membrane lipoprotein-sorting protein